MPSARGSDGRLAPAEPSALRAHRAAAERDVLSCGVLLHSLLTGESVLGSADIAQVLTRIAPLGREHVRLPWTTPQPIAEPLRAIANRSTSSQVRLRYRNARTFLGALTGWRESAAEDDAGPVALLLDRLRTVGHLPALPGLAGRVQRVTAIESQRTDEIARHLLPDMALSFELLRTLSSARVQGTQIAGNGPVLTLRRVVALIGVDGVRAAANSLRAWPGPLDDEGARALRQTIDRVRLAGHLAQALRPAGYDGEAVYLVAALQSLGRLLVRYHFADEAEQIHQLTQPMPASRIDGEIAAPEQPGLGEEAAAYAVLGVDIETLGSAAARHWGLGEEVLHMIRRLPGRRRGAQARRRQRAAAHRRQCCQRDRRCARPAGAQGPGGTEPGHRALRANASGHHAKRPRRDRGRQGGAAQRRHESRLPAARRARRADRHCRQRRRRSAELASESAEPAASAVPGPELHREQRG